MLDGVYMLPHVFGSARSVFMSARAVDSPATPRGNGLLPGNSRFTLHAAQLLEQSAAPSVGLQPYMTMHHAMNANGTLSACADASNNLFIHSCCGERSTWQLTHTDITLLHRELQPGEAITALEFGHPSCGSLLAVGTLLGRVLLCRSGLTLGWTLLGPILNSDTQGRKTVQVTSLTLAPVEVGHVFAATLGSGAVGLAACRECSDPRAAASWAFDHTCRPSAESRASAVTWQPRPEPGGAFFAVVQDATLSLWCLAPRGCQCVCDDLVAAAGMDAPSEPLQCASWAPGLGSPQQRIAVTFGNSVSLLAFERESDEYRPDGNDAIRVVQAGTARKHDSGVTALSWSADGLQLAASCEAGPDGASAVVVWALTADGGLSDQPSAWYRATVDEH